MDQTSQTNVKEVKRKPEGDIGDMGEIDDTIISNHIMKLIHFNPQISLINLGQIHYSDETKYIFQKLAKDKTFDNFEKISTSSLIHLYECEILEFNENNVVTGIVTYQFAIEIYNYEKLEIWTNLFGIDRCDKCYEKTKITACVQCFDIKESVTAKYLQKFLKHDIYLQFVPQEIILSVYCTKTAITSIDNIHQNMKQKINKILFDKQKSNERIIKLQKKNNKKIKNIEHQIKSLSTYLSALQLELSRFQHLNLSYQTYFDEAISDKMQRFSVSGSL